MAENAQETGSNSPMLCLQIAAARTIFFVLKFQDKLYKINLSTKLFNTFAFKK